MSRDRNAPKPSRGSERLAAFLEKRGEAKKLSAKLGVGADLVSRWSRGLAPPNLKHRRILMEATGIGLFEWDDPVSAEGAA